jgi:ATP-binding cassette, subfamily B, bacterial
MRNMTFVLRRHKSALVAVLLVGLVVNTGMTLLTPLFLKFLFDRCIAAKDMRLFVGLLLGFVVLATAWRLLNLYQNLETQKLKNAVFRDMVGEMLRKYYRLAYSEAARFDPGYYSSRIYDEPLAASAATIDLALQMVGGATSFVASTVLLGFLSVQATLLLAVCIPFLIFLAGKYGAAVKRHAAAEKEEEGRLRGFVSKSAQAYRNVRLFALGGSLSTELDARLAVFNQLSYQRFKSSFVHNTAASVLMSYAEVLVIIVCGYEMMHGRMTFGGFMAFMSAFWTAIGSLQSLTQKAPEIARNNSLIERIRDFQSLPEAVEDEGASSENLAFENVSFGYGENAVLSNLSFTIGGADKVLLNGRNGSGKSTVANILTTFLSPTAGGVRTFKIERISACLTPQHFIPGTVADNLGHERLTDSQKRYLARLLKDFDLDGVLSSDPDGLSTGQRKKVELIMGLMKDADLYVFDEPLANVDADSKSKILLHIFERTENKALVVVMHGDDELKTRFDTVVELGLQKRTCLGLPVAA